MPTEQLQTILKYLPWTPLVSGGWEVHYQTPGCGPLSLCQILGAPLAFTYKTNLSFASLHR